MQHTQPLGEHFPRLEQVADICPAVQATGGAAAILTEGALVVHVLFVHDLQPALPRENCAVTRVSAGHNAVEQIDPSSYALEDIDWRADAHEIARFIRRHQRLDSVNDVVHDFRRFTDRQSADGVAVEVKFAYSEHVLGTQIVVNAALINAEQHLARVDRVGQGVQPRHFITAAQQPAIGAVGGFFGVFIMGAIFFFIAGGVRHAFIKRHGDCRAEIRLDLHGFLRAHENRLTVHMRVEMYALLRDFTQLGK